MALERATGDRKGDEVSREHLFLACEAGSPRRGRRFAAQLAAGHTSCDDVELLTSELVTNAIRHGQTEMLVTVDVDDGRVRVEVADRNPARPQLREPDERGGRGLHLVDELSDRWGVHGGRPVMTFWFEIEDGAELRRERRLR